MLFRKPFDKGPALEKMLRGHTQSSLTSLPLPVAYPSGRPSPQQAEPPADTIVNMKVNFDVLNSHYSYKENHEYIILSKVIENISGFLCHMEEWCDTLTLYLHMF